MTLSPSLSRLVNEARDAGFSVVMNGNRVDIYKGRNPSRHSLPNRGVRIYLSPTGAFHMAHRIDVDLSLALDLRTIKLTREVLGL